MKKFLMAAAGATALILAAAPTQAAVHISFDGTTAYQSFANDNVPNSIFLGGAACTAPGNPCGGYDSVNVGTNPLLEPISLLHAYAIEANATGNAALTVYVTRTGLSNARDYKAFAYQLAGTSAAAGGFTVNYSLFVDPTNGTGAGGLFADDPINALASVTTSTPGFGSGLQQVGYSGLTGPFALTARFTLASSGRASLAPTAEIAGIVPEPTTWALMIGGFGGAGAMLRRRRAISAAA